MQTVGNFPGKVPPFCGSQAVGGASGTNSRPKQNFIGIYVANSGNYALVEQAPFYWFFPLFQPALQIFRVAFSG